MKEYRSHYQGAHLNQIMRERAVDEQTQKAARLYAKTPQGRTENILDRCGATEGERAVFGPLIEAQFEGNSHES